VGRVGEDQPISVEERCLRLGEPDAVLLAVGPIFAGFHPKLGLVIRLPYRPPYRHMAVKSADRLRPPRYSAVAISRSAGRETAGLFGCSSQVRFPPTVTPVRGSTPSDSGTNSLQPSTG
jgi:hypothetical protein